MAGISRTRAERPTAEPCGRQIQNVHFHYGRYPFDKPGCATYHHAFVDGLPAGWHLARAVKDHKNDWRQR